MVKGVDKRWVLTSPPGREEVRARRLRRGGVSFLLIVVIAIAVACLALAYDIACLAHARQELRAACQASALAGAGQLLDTRPLYPRRPADSPNSEGGSSSRQGGRGKHRSTQLWEAKRTAIEFAQRNTFAGQPLKLADEADLKQKRVQLEGKELQFGWVPDSTVLSWDFHQDVPIEKVNSLQVQLVRSSDHLPKMLSRLFGGRYDIHCVARATMDQQVFGFRPTRAAPAPVLPLLIEFRDPLQALAVRRGACEYRGCRDEYRVDERTEEVKRGSDGIPEFVFRLSTEDRGDRGRTSGKGVEKTTGLTTGGGRDERRSGELHVLDLGDGDMSDFRRQVRDGLSSRDLEAIGGRLALDEKGRVRVETRTDARRFAASIGATLERVRGEKRVLCWGATKNLGRDQQWDAVALGFFAGRVINVDSDSQGFLVRIQPCVMQTSTALIRSGEPRNAWVGKLVLNR